MQCECVFVCGGGVGRVEKRERGRKEKAERTREGGNESVILKHLRKHFPLSYHLDVVSGTRSTNVFPRSTPPSFSFVRLFGKGIWDCFFPLVIGTEHHCSVHVGLHTLNKGDCRRL